MPWSHFITLATRAPQFAARELYQAMSAHIWALQMNGADGVRAKGLQDEYQRVRVLAFPGSLIIPGFALKQSKE